MGTFLVFRTNLIDSKIDRMDMHLMEILKVHCNRLYPPVAISKVTLESIEPFLVDKSLIFPMGELIDQYQSLLLLRKLQTKESLFSFLYVIGIIFFAIVCIYLTPYLQVFPALGKAILRCEILISAWGLFECCLYVWGLLKEHPFTE